MLLAQGRKMKVVYEATRNYYKFLPATIQSLLDHNDPEVIYILAEDDTIEGLPSVCQVINVSNQPWIKRTSPNYHTVFSYMVLLRVCLPEILDCDRVLQLDVDTIVCDSLQELWDTDLTGKWFAAVPEYISNNRPYGKRYYNVGVCLFNLAQMRKDNIVPSFIAELNDNYYPYPEQDVLNKYGQANDKAVVLLPRYNTSYCCGLPKNPAIVHFAGINNWWDKQHNPKWDYLAPYAPLITE